MVEVQAEAVGEQAQIGLRKGLKFANLIMDFGLVMDVRMSSPATGSVDTNTSAVTVMRSLESKRSTRLTTAQTLLPPPLLESRLLALSR